MVYPLPQGFTLGPQDSGNAEAPVVWRAFEKEHPVLIGGRAVSGWKLWKDGIFTADLAAQGFKGVALKQLIFNGERQPLARYPNFDSVNPIGGGWAYVDGEMWPMYVEREGEDKRTLLVKPEDWRNCVATPRR